MAGDFISLWSVDGVRPNKLGRERFDAYDKEIYDFCKDIIQRAKSDCFSPREVTREIISLAMLADADFCLHEGIKLLKEEKSRGVL